MSWFTSAPAEPKAGRTFNLQSGKIASTELTHKYRMQVEETEPEQTTNGGEQESEAETVLGESVNAEQIKNKLISNHIVNNQRAGRKLSTESSRSTVSSVGINVNGVAQQSE